MPVIPGSVKEVQHGRDGDFDHKGGRRYMRVFVARTDSALDGPNIVRLGTGVPRLFSPYITATEFDTGALCIKVHPEQPDDDNPQFWKIFCTYDSKHGEEQQADPNPILRPSEIRWSFQTFQKAIDIDRRGMKIVNTAGDPYDPPPEIDDSRPVLSVTRPELNFNQSLATQYQDAINSDNFFGVGPKQAKVAGIGAIRMFESGLFFWEVTYEIHFRASDDNWQLRLLNAGFHEMVDDTGGQKVRKPIVASGGQPVSSPALLGLNGRVLPPDTNQVIYNTFDVYRELPFSALNLP